MRSVSLLLLPLVLAASGCSQRVTPFGPGYIVNPNEDERRLWETSVADSEAIKASGKLYRDAELETYLNSVLERLLGEHRKAYLPLRPRVYILDSPTVNAFAWPHGDIYVHTGLLGRIRNEAQLTMLLGHELTHGTHRHAHQRLKHAYASSGANAYIGVLAALGGGNIQRLVAGLSKLMTLASISGYGRDKEEEADNVGLTLMAQAGYDPHEGGKMFVRMRDATDSKDRGWNFFYATHPKMKNRVKSCKKLVAQMPPELLAEAKVTGVERYLDVALRLVHEEVERHIVQGKFELAGETLDFLRDARPQDAKTHAYRGELCRARGNEGDSDQARQAYETALKLDPREPLALRGLGLLCLRLGDEQNAIRYLQAYLAEAGDAVDARFIAQTIERLKGE